MEVLQRQCNVLERAAFVSSTADGQAEREAVSLYCSPCVGASAGLCRGTYPSQAVAAWWQRVIVSRCSHFPTPQQIDNLNTVKSMFRSAKLQPKIGAQGMVWVLLKANAPLDVRIVHLLFGLKWRPDSDNSAHLQQYRFSC